MVPSLQGLFIREERLQGAGRSNRQSLCVCILFISSIVELCFSFHASGACRQQDLGLHQVKATRGNIYQRPACRRTSLRLRGGSMGSVSAAPSPQPMDAEEVAKHLWQKRDLFKTNLHAVIRCGNGEPRYRLAYMPCRNRGETIRLILEEARVPYEVEVVGFEKWKEYVKASTPHGKLPVLRNFDGSGRDLGQEGAITRFLAEELGLAGNTPAEKAQVDALYCQWWATLRNNGVSHSGEHYSVAALKQGGDGKVKTAKDVVRYQAMFRQNSLPLLERSLSALRFFEDTLARSPDAFLVSSSPTYVDLALWYVLFELAEDDNVPDFAARFDLPLLGTFLATMSARPSIADFVRSARRMPRYERDPSGASLYTYLAGNGSPER